jgi:hypothetical protein
MCWRSLFNGRNVPPKDLSALVAWTGPRPRWPCVPNNVCSIWRIMKYLTAKVNTPYAPRSTPGTVLSGQKWPAPRSTREEPFATRTNL